MQQGLEQRRREFVTKVKLNLSMSKLEHFTVAKLKKFAQDLDSIADPDQPTKNDHLKTLNFFYSGQMFNTSDN